MKKRLLHHGRCVILCCILLLGACFAQPTIELTPTIGAPFVIRQAENPYTPKPEDVNMEQAGVILTSLDLSEPADITPLQSELTILGFLPSVCSELRIKVNPPNDFYRIDIEIYSIVNPNLNCENVFQQFETGILLGEYSAGQYSIWVNDEFVGDIVSY